MPYGNYSSTPSAATIAEANNRVIETACNWAVNIANDDSHGYSQSNRWGPNYDCSSLVISSYRAAGLSINANSTYDMVTGFKAAGFSVIPFTSGMTLLRGDVLLNPSSHTALYLGNSLVVEAHLAENGTISGQTGDQGYYMYRGQRVNQGEISVGTYRFSRTWDYVLRYGAGYVGSDSDVIIPVGQNSTYTATPDGVITKPQDNISGITVYNDVRNGNPNDRHDMTLREIGYFGDNSKFVTEPTDITISAINYTTLLGNLYDQFATYYPYGYTTDTSQLGGNIRVCVDYFQSKGLNPAVACGITASLFTLSGIGTVYKGGGICAWDGKYRQDMHIRVDGWETNLSGQLDYLWIDLSLNYGIMMQLFTEVPVTDNGARQAANRFIVSYRYTDQPQDVDTEVANSTKAQRIAAEWFNQLIINPIIPEGSTYSSPQSVTIPISGSLSMTPISLDYAGGDTVNPAIDDVLLPSPKAGQIYSFAQCPYPQSGIDTNFTSYSYWADRFNQSSPQYQLAQIWKNQYNMSCNRGIATIAGFYLAAVTETFGVVGDAIRVTLDNGEAFSVIIADIKSSHDSNYCQWGHIQNGKVNVIEWEIVKVENGRAVLSGSSTAGYPCDVSGWQGVPVRTIEHIGKKFSLSWR